MMGEERKTSPVSISLTGWSLALTIRGCLTRERPAEELIHSAEANGRGRGVHCDLRDRLVLEGCSSWVIMGGGAAGVGSLGDGEA